ncbi:ABC transporter ATP-binding protein [Klebsiella pneumoniae subsp. rhinoscleromatis]|nr:ABC transporter ATP-binding protein [Klebsiella pneumoniae subsp. rhinoscleromatis]
MSRLPPWTYRWQAQILQLLRELKQELNMGLLFITHNLSIVRQLADRVAVMQNGPLRGNTMTVGRCSARQRIPTPNACWIASRTGSRYRWPPMPQCCCRRTI